MAFSNFEQERLLIFDDFVYVYILYKMCKGVKHRVFIKERGIFSFIKTLDEIPV
jgi:hypothetical protein